VLATVLAYGGEVCAEVSRPHLATRHFDVIGNNVWPLLEASGGGLGRCSSHSSDFLTVIAATFSYGLIHRRLLRLPLLD